MKSNNQSRKGKPGFNLQLPHNAAIHAPLYVAAFALFVVYAIGYLEVLPFQYAVGMIGVTFMSEMLMPSLGPALRRARTAQDRALLIASVVACVLLGALGGTVALSAADAPRVAYEEARGLVEAAQTRLAAAQTALESVPTCTPDMPRSRCIQQTDNNAATLQDRTMTRDEAKGARDGAQHAFAALPVPGPGLPQVPPWQKALIMGGIAFVLFAVPYATHRVPVATPEPVHVKKPAPMEEPKPVNDGGWATRRAKYGANGRKPSRTLKLVRG